MILVTKPYFPDIEKYKSYIDKIYENQWLTNNGPLVNKLKSRLEDYLGVENLLLVANGTLALQIALAAMEVNGSAITTPYTFVATSGAMKWNGIRPIYADIDAGSYNLDPKGFEELIKPDTTAVVPVHVFGNPCDVDGIERFAVKNKLKVIYDAAHAFSVKLRGNSILNHGDASILSFHATKIFHCVEGGAIVFKRSEDYERAKKMINFGIDTETSLMPEIGINAKMSEVHAAMGLCVLDEIDDLIEKRIALASYYDSKIGLHNQAQVWDKESLRNGSYYPFTFLSEPLCVDVLGRLTEKNIFARRYFQHSLDSVEVYGDTDCCPISRNLSRRVLCLPLYADLPESVIDVICNTILGVLK